MEGFTKVLLCVTIVFYFIDIGFGLSCLSCQSPNVTSRCREGRRSKQPKVETCYGRKAKCFAAVIVNEYGEALFQRGCSKFGVCIEDENIDDLEFCQTCQYNHCNYEFMELDEELEDYLLGNYESYESYLPGEVEIPQEGILVEEEVLGTSDDTVPLVVPVVPEEVERHDADSEKPPVTIIEDEQDVVSEKIERYDEDSEKHPVTVIEDEKDVVGEKVDRYDEDSENQPVIMIENEKDERSVSNFSHTSTFSL